MKYTIGDEASRRRILDVIGRLGKGVWTVEVKRYQKTRSLAQNERWQAITRLIAIETGESHERVKQQLKFRFGFYEMTEVQGVKLAVLRSTTKATTAELADLMEQAEAFAATELGISP